MCIHDLYITAPDVLTSFLQSCSRSCSKVLTFPVYALKGLWFSLRRKAPQAAQIIIEIYHVVESRFPDPNTRYLTIAATR